MKEEALRNEATFILKQEAAAAEWCAIGKIPTPPPHIHKAAGGGPLRPGIPALLGCLGYLLFYVSLPLIAVIAWVDHYGGILFYTPREHRERRQEAREKTLREKAISESGLDCAFDGDWSGDAGQLLLQWYSQSPHPKRLVIVAHGRIVLAAPPKRVAFGAAGKSRVVHEIPATQAHIEDPLFGNWATGLFRITFNDGSWISFSSTEDPGDIHRLMQDYRCSISNRVEGVPVKVSH